MSRSNRPAYARASRRSTKKAFSRVRVFFFRDRAIGGHRLDARLAARCARVSTRDARFPIPRASRRDARDASSRRSVGNAFGRSRSRRAMRTWYRKIARARVPACGASRRWRRRGCRRGRRGEGETARTRSRSEARPRWRSAPPLPARRAARPCSGCSAYGRHRTCRQAQRCAREAGGREIV